MESKRARSFCQTKNNLPIAEKNRFCIDNDGSYLPDSAVAIIPKNINIYFLLGLLNSKLIEGYISSTSPYVQGKYYNYSKGYIEKIPIKIPVNENEESLADKIISNVKEIIKIRDIGNIN